MCHAIFQWSFIKRSVSRVSSCLLPKTCEVKTNLLIIVRFQNPANALPQSTILDKTLGKNCSLSIIWHALTKYIGPSPTPPKPMLTIWCKIYCASLCPFFNQHWNGGRGESWKNLIFITQTNESVTFSQRVLSKIVANLVTPIPHAERDTPQYVVHQVSMPNLPNEKLLRWYRYVIKWDE